MEKAQHPVGFLQGRLTPQDERGFQYFPNRVGEWESEFERAKQIGAECIELLIERRADLYDLVHPLASDTNADHLKSVIASTGVPVLSIHTFFEHDATYAEELKTIVIRAAAVGARMIMVPFFDEYSITGGRIRSDIAALLAPAIGEAAARGMKIGIEAEVSAQDIVEFTGHCSVPLTVGINYDIGNAFACGFPVLEEIRAYGKHIVGVHVKDRTRLPDGLAGKTTPLGSGSADLKGAINEMIVAGYAGPFIVQGARQEGRDDNTVVAEYISLVRTLIDGVTNK